MKIQTTFPVESIDLTPLTRLVFPLWGQWDSLRFAADGTLLNGMTGDQIPHFRLVDGQHKRTGSTYAVVTPALDPDRPDAPQSIANFVRLQKDDRHILEVSVLPEKSHADRYSGSGQLNKLAWPSAEVTGTVRHSGVSSNPLVRSSVGTGTELSGRFDSEILQAGNDGQVASGTWRAGRFGGTGSVDVRQTSAEWREATVTASLTGRGIFRPLVFIFSPLLRRLARPIIADMHADFTGEFPNLRLDLADIEAATKTDADARLFVHRLLWEPGFLDSGLFPRSDASKKEEQMNPSPGSLKKTRE